MGEIKSTLDIIMEKTKGLTMSDEEKREYKEREARGKIKGVIQKYLDGILDLDRVKKEMASISRDEPQMINHLVAQELISRISPGKGNEPLLRLLEDTAGLNADPIKEMLADFESKLKREKGAREKALEKTFRRKGIFGSAVIPNINADSEWITLSLKMEGEFQENIKRLFNLPF